MGPLHVLLVEDDPNDAALTRALLRETKLTLDLDLVEDGEAALRYLRRQAPYEAQKAVDLVILDINLPKVGGFEVLKQMQQDSALREIPVCVVTVSDRPEDQARAKAAGACCFVTKPLDLVQFTRIVQKFDPFWLTMVRAPKPPPSPPPPSPPAPGA